MHSITPTYATPLLHGKLTCQYKDNRLIHQSSESMSSSPTSASTSSLSPSPPSPSSSFLSHIASFWQWSTSCSTSPNTSTIIRPLSPVLIISILSVFIIVSANSCVTEANDAKMIENRHTVVMPSQTPPAITARHHTLRGSLSYYSSLLRALLLAATTARRATTTSTINSGSTTHNNILTDNSLTCHTRQSINSEVKQGECMFHFECHRKGGHSIGPCVANHFIGSCCVTPTNNSSSSSSSATPVLWSNDIDKLQHPLGNGDGGNGNGTGMGDNNNNSNSNDVQKVKVSSVTTMEGQLNRNRFNTEQVSKHKYANNGTESFIEYVLNSTTATPTTIVNDEMQEEYKILVINNRMTTTTTTTTPTTVKPLSTLTSTLRPQSAIHHIILNTHHIPDVFSNHFPVTIDSSNNGVEVKNTNQTNTATSNAVTKTVVTSTPITTLLNVTTKSNIAHALPQIDLDYQCGIRPLRPTARVIGGRDAALGEWPWMVIIKENAFWGLSSRYKCGGVLIASSWVLTAAHCQPNLMGQLFVVFGQHEFYYSPMQRQYKPLIRIVKRFILHRDYDPETYDNDIALIELETPVESKPHVVPICMPTIDTIYSGRIAHIAGFGKMKYGSSEIPARLQTVSIPIIDNEQCQDMFTSAGHYKPIRPYHICAGYTQGGKDACEGDSGGPLMVQEEDTGRWILAGIVSHGIKCAMPNLPGVYMKVAAYNDWIYSIIDDE